MTNIRKDVEKSERRNAGIFLNKFNTLVQDRIWISLTERIKHLQVLLPAKFNEFCLVLGVKEMCCLEPEKKIIEKAFRKKALKCHPDKVTIF